MALVNRKLAGVETLFLPAAPDLEHISSSIVRTWHGTEAM